MKLSNIFIKRFVMISLIILLACILFYSTIQTIHKKEKMDIQQQDKVVFIIPSTSRKMNYNEVESCTLLNVLYDSLKKIDISKYTFLIGIDDNDEFYLKNIEEIKKRLPNNFHFKFYDNYDKSYVCIVNQLANTAIQEYNAEYLYIFADDLNVFKLDFIDTFIDYFKQHENIALGWGIDDNNPYMCTHPFLSKRHVEIFGYFYPPSIKNWSCDVWAEKLYEKLNRISKTDTAVIKNTIVAGELSEDKKRYDIVDIDKDKLNKMIDDAAAKLSNVITV